MAHKLNGKVLTRSHLGTFRESGNKQPREYPYSKRGSMSPRRNLKELFRKSVLPPATPKRSAKFDENYPEHITSWASRLKNSVEGLRDDSTDLQKKYEGAPLRRKSKAKKPVKKTGKR
jgi:hypothetical protein